MFCDVPSRLRVVTRTADCARDIGKGEVMKPTMKFHATEISVDMIGFPTEHCVQLRQLNYISQW